MNQLYTLVETIINQGSSEALANLITSLNENPGAKSKQYECSDNLFYVLRRLVGSSLARDPKLKQNSIEALNQIQQNVEDLNNINKTAFGAFFLSISDLKDCTNKQQTNAFIQGKISVAKCLSQYLKDNEKVVANLVDLAAKNQHFQEQLVQVLFVICGQKLPSLKLSLTNANATFLYKILLKKGISQENISSIITEAIEHYPKESITLKYLGLNLEANVPTPQQFFKKNYSEFINISQEQTEDGDLKKLYYLLQIQKHFLSHVTINRVNIANFFCIEIVIAWLEQLRVKNKHMRKLANQIVINFQKDADFSFQILKFLHEKDMYLENVSLNHPFAELYANVQGTQFWDYLVALVQKQNTDEEKDQDEETPKRQEYLSELQYFTRERMNDLNSEQIGQTLTLLIKAYQQSKKSEKLLNLVWSLFHHQDIQIDLKKKNKKKIVLNTKGPFILGKIKLNDLELQTEIQELISKVIKFLRVKVKGHKQTGSKINIAFLNFITSLIIYTIVYPEQSDVCAEIQFISKDLQSFLAKQQSLDQGKDTPKKKRKVSQEVEDQKKPIHVLVEVFISLLTKAPVFLRNAINLLFEQLVPYLETSDLQTLLQVIQKPDQQYIEQI